MKKCPSPKLEREMLSPALKAAYDVAKGDAESFDALIRKIK